MMKGNFNNKDLKERLKSLNKVVSGLEGIVAEQKRMAYEMLDTIPEGKEKDVLKSAMEGINTGLKNRDTNSITDIINKIKDLANASKGNK